MLQLDELLQRLELLIRDSKKSVFSNAVLVNPDEVYRIIGAIRDAIPEVVKEAKMIVDRKNDILTEEQNRASIYIQNVERKAQEILTEARAEASRLTSESEILKQAEADAKCIKEETNIWVKNMTTSTRQNVIDMFENVKNVLSDSLDDTEKAIDYIKKTQFTD